MVAPYFVAWHGDVAVRNVPCNNDLYSICQHLQHMRGKACLMEFLSDRTGSKFKGYHHFLQSLNDKCFAIQRCATQHSHNLHDAVKYLHHFCRLDLVFSNDSELPLWQ